MPMNMEFKRKLACAPDREGYVSGTEEMAQNKRENDRQIQAVITGGDPRLMLLIGPCSADREDAVLEYAARLRWTGRPLLSALSAERLNSTDRKPLLLHIFRLAHGPNAVYNKG